MYAIIATGGKQYKVSEGDVIDVEKIAVEAGSEVTFDNVLAIGGETLKVAGDVAGRPATTKRTAIASSSHVSRSTRSTRNPRTHLLRFS